MQDILGRPVREALSSLPEGTPPPRMVETRPPRRDGETKEGTLRVVAVREGVWILARFLDQPPREKEKQ